MFELEDVYNVEGEAEDEESYFISLQKAINSGMWSLQGSYGRTMMDAIESGRCVLGREGCKDYWGNYIPSRTEVQSGTKGSEAFVAERSGKDWAEMVTEV